MKFNQDLCLNLQYDFGKMNSTLGSVVPLAMFTKSPILLKDSKSDANFFLESFMASLVNHMCLFSARPLLVFVHHHLWMAGEFWAEVTFYNDV